MKITVTSTTKTGADMKDRVYTVEAIDIEARYSGDFKVIVEDGKARVFRLEEPGHYEAGAWQVKPVSIFGEPHVEAASDFENQAVAKILAMPLLTNDDCVEDMLERAAAKSPAVRDLLDYQVAIDRAIERVMADGDRADFVVYKAVAEAIRAHSAAIAERMGADEATLTMIEKGSGFRWAQVVYMLLERVPKFREFVESK